MFLLLHSVLDRIYYPSSTMYNIWYVDTRLCPAKPLVLSFDPKITLIDLSEIGPVRCMWFIPFQRPYVKSPKPQNGPLAGGTSQ